MNIRPAAPLLALLVWAGLCAVARGADLHVSPAGVPDGDGSEARPLDLATALNATDRVKLGDTVRLHAGTYRHPLRDGDAAYEVKLQGSADAPVHVRPATAGGRVTIDGGLRVVEPPRLVWLRDLELTVSEPRRES